VGEQIGADNVVHAFDSAVDALQPLIDSLTWT
jgi:hypothetical protein